MNDCELDLLHNHDTTLERWYQRNRTTDAPLTSCRVYRLARKIRKEEFRNVIEFGELACEIIYALKNCFKHFDKSFLPEGKFVEDGFVEFFRLVFKRRLYDLAAGKNAQRRRRTVSLDEVPPPVASGKDDREVEEEWQEWSRRLVQCVLPKLPSRMQQVVQYRHFDGLGTEEVVAITGISANSIKQRYGLGKISKSIRKEINLMITSIPIEQLDRAIYYLAFNKGLSCKYIADLFCIDEALVKQSVDRAADKIIDSLNREGAMLFVMPK